jgi:TRAP transporter TAXI family solute receptor
MMSTDRREEDMTETSKPAASSSPPSDREGWKVWGSAILLALVGFVVAAQYVGPAPPTNIVLATGVSTEAYHRFGERYREQLAQHGIDVELRTTAGSLENLELLQGSQVDVGFVQGGTVPRKLSAELEGIASLYYEPLWVFHRAEKTVQHLSDLRGLRVQFGQRGSGTRAVATQLLAANGVTPQTAIFVGKATRGAVQDLLAGTLDALLVVTSPRSETVKQLMLAEGGALRLLDFERQDSYAQLYSHLAPVVLRRGVLDLAGDLPDHDVRLISPTASLVAAEGLHPALVPLFIEAAETIHGEGGMFERAGEFPSAKNLAVEPSFAAAHYYATGPNFLYRILPFRTAAMLDRLKIMLLPLLTLLLPLLKFAPPLYRWRIRSKIYRWYRVLHDLELQSNQLADSGDRSKLIEKLRHIEREITSVRVPPSYGSEFYNLRMHLEQVQSRVSRG